MLKRLVFRIVVKGHRVLFGGEADHDIGLVADALQNGSIGICGEHLALMAENQGSYPFAIRGETLFVSDVEAEDEIDGRGVLLKHF